MPDDIVDRLRKATGLDLDLKREAAGEIERLQSRLRFTDAVIRSGDVAALTDAEREALEWFTHGESPFPEEASRMATVRGLLERLA